MRDLRELLEVSSTDLDDARQRKLLKLLLLGMAVILATAFAVTVLLDLLNVTGEDPIRARYTALGAFSLICALSYFIDRFISHHLASGFLVLLLAVTVAFVDMPEEVANGRGLLFFTFPIFVASVLLHPLAGFVIAAISSILIALVGLRANVMPSAFGMIGFFATATVAWFSGHSLRDALDSLRSVNRELDERVSVRTKELRKRSMQLRTAAEVARDATAILDVDRLLDETVRIISDRFGFYHAGVFLIDEQGEYALLKSASSEGGQRMLEKNHRLKVGEVGIVGHVAGSKEPRIALDVGRDAVYFDNVDLPETRSEMALPLKIRGDIIGVLDVQSVEAEAFTDEDVATLQTMADQLANAIENARLYEEARQRLDEAQLVQEVTLAAASTLDFDRVLERSVRALHRAWDIDRLEFLLPDQERKTLAPHPSLVGFPEADFRIPIENTKIGQVYRYGMPLLIEDSTSSTLYPNQSPDIRSAMAIPVRVGGEVLALLHAESVRRCAFGEDELRLATTVAGQLGVMLENARLYQEMEQHTESMGMLAEVSAGMISSLRVKEIVDHLLRALMKRFQALCLISLLDKETDEIEVVADWGPGYVDNSLEKGGRLLVSDHRGLQRVIENGTTLYVPDVRSSELWDLLSDREKAFVHKWDVRAALFLPMISQERVVGVVSLRFYEPCLAPTPDQIDWAQTLTNQATAALVNAQLYEEVEAQAVELSKAYDELQEINRLRNQLVQNVSHELRTPLSLIQGYVELLLRESLGPINERQKGAFQIIRDRTATLARLIHNLTMLQAVPRDALTMTPLSVVQVVRSVKAEFEEVAREQGVVFKDMLPVDLPQALGDKERLKLVFGHLIDNAIKFSPNGGTITITGHADEESVFVSIADEGIGIPSEHLDRIFERFYQVDGSTKRRFGGMGVGLALVWEIVEAHGGEVDVRSAPGDGSTFTVGLPQAIKVASLPLPWPREASEN